MKNIFIPDRLLTDKRKFIPVPILIDKRKFIPDPTINTKQLTPAVSWDFCL